MTEFQPIHPAITLTSTVQDLVKINGVNVTSKIVEYELEQAWGDAIAQLEIKFVRGVSGLLTITAGQTVEVFRAFISPPQFKIFSGYVESIEYDGGHIKVTCKDKLWDLVRKEVTTVYDSSGAQAGKISAIFQDLVETYAGLSADSSTIQDSGTTTIIDQFVCNHSDIMDRCKVLADILDWQFYYRADTDMVYFEPKGYNTNTDILTVGSSIIEVPKWTSDITEMANDITVIGASQLVETTESGRIGVTSGYTTTSITIGFEPNSVKLYMDASNPPTTLKIGGIPNISTSFDYYVDKANKKIIPRDTTTFTTNDYAEVRYSYFVPIPLPLEDATSITTYGRFTKTLIYSDIRNVDDATSRGQKYLDKYSEPFMYTTIKVKITNMTNLRIGDLIRVQDSVNNPTIDDFFIITRLIWRYPANYYEAVVGDKTWRLSAWQESIETRIKRVSESNLKTF